MNDMNRKNSYASLLPIAVVALAAFVLYIKTAGYGFIPTWDDGEYVLNNIYIRGVTADNLR